MRITKDSTYHLLRERVAVALGARARMRFPDRKLARSLLLIIYGIAISIETFAADVSNTIVNQVWTSNNSPYRVVGDIQVAGLTIQPGVTVFFASNFVFEVAGKLKAIGTRASPILFTATNAGWQGIFFNTAQPGCELAHCIIERSVNSGVRIVNTPRCVLAHCTIANSLNSGIRIVNSVPSISDCIIRSNSVSVSATGGGGTHTLEAYGGGIVTDSPLVLDNCIIEKNSLIVAAQGNLVTTTVKGGGIYSTALLTLLNCTVSSNSISATSIGYNTVDDLTALSEGGGVWSLTNLTLQNCLIRENSAYANAAINAGPSSSAVSLGGGIWCTRKSIQRNAIIAGNVCSAVWAPSSFFTVKGGGVFITGAGSSNVNCTVAYNTPDGLATDTNATVVLNSIFWGNTTTQVVGTTNVSYSDVQGGFAGPGNISGNPVLSSENLIVVPGSPCVNAGDTNAAYTNVFFPPSLGRVRNDMGAHGGPGAGARLRARYVQQMEVVFLGGVPGYNYLLEGSTNLSGWQTVSQFQIANLGDYAAFLEPSTDDLPYRFYRLNIGP